MCPLFRLLETEHDVASRQWFRSRLTWISAAVIITLLGAAFVLRTRSSETITQVPFSDLLRDLDGGVVTAVIVNGDTLEFKLNDGRTLQTTAPINYVTANPTFIGDLARKGVRIDVKTASEQSPYSYGAFLLGLAFVGVLGFT